MSKQRVMPFFALAGRSSELRSLPNCQPTYGTCPVTQELKFRMATNCSDGFTGNYFFRRKILYFFFGGGEAGCSTFSEAVTVRPPLH